MLPVSVLLQACSYAFKQASVFENSLVNFSFLFSRVLMFTQVKLTSKGIKSRVCFFISSGVINLPFISKTLPREVFATIALSILAQEEDNGAYEPAYKSYFSIFFQKN